MTRLGWAIAFIVVSAWSVTPSVGCVGHTTGGVGVRVAHRTRAMSGCSTSIAGGSVAASGDGGGAGGPAVCAIAGGVEAGTC